MARGKFNEQRYNKWVEETNIPNDVMAIVEAVSKYVGYPLDKDCIEVVTERNRYGDIIYSYKGFQITHCTSSYATGPTADYTGVLIKWLGGLGFKVVNSYGDNGMDSATNWHDTYWTKEIAYMGTRKYEGDFWDYPDDCEDYDEYDEYDDC